MSIQRPSRPLSPWNRGRNMGQKLPLQLRDILGIRIRLQLQHRIRDLALFNLAIDSKLSAPPPATASTPQNRPIF